MHLTLYTDYTLRVMMYLAVKYESGEVATIHEMAQAYGISRNHLTKIVNELAQNGFIETTRGRSGGARLARRPSEISVGSLVRMAEKDFAIVQCHTTSRDANCVILPACNLRNGLRRAADAFLHELDKMTLADSIIAPSVAASILNIRPSGSREVTVPLTAISRKPRSAPESRSPQPRAGKRARGRSASTR